MKHSSSVNRSLSRKRSVLHALDIRLKLQGNFIPHLLNNRPETRLQIRRPYSRNSQEAKFSKNLLIMVTNLSLKSDAMVWLDLCECHCSRNLRPSYEQYTSSSIDHEPSVHKNFPAYPWKIDFQLSSFYMRLIFFWKQCDFQTLNA